MYYGANLSSEEQKTDSTSSLSDASLLRIRETNGEEKRGARNRGSSPVHTTTAVPIFHHYSSPQTIAGSGVHPNDGFALPASFLPRQSSIKSRTNLLAPPSLFPSLLGEDEKDHLSNDRKDDEYSIEEQKQTASGPDDPDSSDSSSSDDDDDDTVPLIGEVEEKSDSPSKKAAAAKKYSIFYLSLMGIFSLIASGSNAIFAMCKTPENIHEWWENLSDAERVEAAWIFTASLSVNFILGFDSIPDAIETLHLSYLQENKSFKEKSEIAVTVILGASAALASAAISYSAFTWAPPYVTYAVALTSLGINFTTRYVGCKNLFNRVYTYYDNATIEKNRFLDDLNYLNPRYAKLVEVMAQLSIKESGIVDDKAVNLFTKRLLAQQNLTSDFTIKKRPIDWAGHYAARGFETTFSVLIGVAALPTFDQKGVDGLSKIVELKLPGGIQHAPAVARFFAGFLPGSATAILYAASAIDLPKLAYDVVGEIASRRSLKLFTIFAFLTIANYFASASLESIEEGILKRDDRVFTFLTLTNFLGILSIYLNRTGAFATNTKASYAKFFSKPAKENAGLIDIKKYLKTRNKTLPLDEDTQHYVNRFSKFAHLDSPPMTGQNGQNEQNGMNGSLSITVIPAEHKRHRAETEMTDMPPANMLLPLRTRNSF